MFRRALVLFLFNISISFSNTNILEVTVFSAPIFKAADRQSIVIERIEKGSQVLSESTLRLYTSENRDDGNVYHKIVTKKGSVGFIKQIHVQSVTSVAKKLHLFDETNYSHRMNKLHEEKVNGYNSKVIFLGSFPKSIATPMKQEISILDQSLSYGLGYMFSKKMNLPNEKKYFIGGALRYFYDKSSFLDSNSEKFTESLAAYSIGPTFSFITQDILGFKNEAVIGPTLSIVGLSAAKDGVNFNYNRLTPGLHLSNYTGIENILPNIDFLIGLSFDINFLKLNKTNSSQTPTISNEITIENPYSIQASILLGFQFNQ